MEGWGKYKIYVSFQFIISPTNTNPLAKIEFNLKMCEIATDHLYGPFFPFTVSFFCCSGLNEPSRNNLVYGSLTDIQSCK